MPKFTWGTYDEAALRAVTEDLRGIAGAIDGLADALRQWKLPTAMVRGEADKNKAIANLESWCGFAKEAIKEARQKRGDFGRPVPDVSESTPPSPENQDLTRKTGKRSSGKSKTK